MTQRVKPLFEDASASYELREFVELARRDGPSHAELKLLAARVEAAAGIAVAAPLVEAGGIGSAPEQVVSGGEYVMTALGKSSFANLLSSTSAKLVAAVGLSAGLGFGIWSQVRTSSPARAPTAIEAARVPLAEVVQPQPSAPAVLDPVPVVEPLEPKPEPLSHDEATKPKRVADKSRTQRAELMPVEPAHGPREVTPSPPPPSELSLIQQAQSLRSDVARALRLLDDHARLYPNGVLAQEREVLAIEVLLRAGELAQGRSRAERFLHEHADSAHLPRLQALIARTSRE